MKRGDADGMTNFEINKPQTGILKMLNFILNQFFKGICGLKKLKTLTQNR